MSEEEVNAPVEEAPVEETPAEEPKAEEPAEEPKEEKKAAPACSGGSPMEMMYKPFQESEFFGDMKNIFMWKDLMISLAVFVVVNVFFVLLLCYEFTVLGLLCWIAFFATIAGLVFDILRVIAYFKDEQAESKLAGFNFEVPAKWIDGAFDFFKSLFKAFLGVCINAILVRDVVFSLCMLGGFLLIIYLAAHWGFCWHALCRYPLLLHLVPSL